MCLQCRWLSGYEFFYPVFITINLSFYFNYDGFVGSNSLGWLLSFGAWNASLYKMAWLLKFLFRNLVLFKWTFIYRWLCVFLLAVMCLCTHSYTSASFPLPSGSCVSNLGCQNWQQMPVLAEPSLCLHINLSLSLSCVSVPSTLSLSHDSLSSFWFTLLVRLFKELLIWLIECFFSSISICSFILAFLTCWILFSYNLCLLISFSCLCILSILHCNLCLHSHCLWPGFYIAGY